MLPVVKIALIGLTSSGASVLTGRLFSTVVKNSSGFAKILLWFGSAGISLAVSGAVAREVNKQFDEAVDAIKDMKDHVEIED